MPYALTVVAWIIAIFRVIWLERDDKNAHNIAGIFLVHTAVAVAIFALSVAFRNRRSGGRAASDFAAGIAGLLSVRLADWISFLALICVVLCVWLIETALTEWRRFERRWLPFAFFTPAILVTLLGVHYLT